MHYSFYFEEGSITNSYFFATDNSILYEVKFKPSFYLVEHKIDKSFENSVFEFVIDIAEKPANLRPPLDSKIPITVGYIFNDFFNKNNGTICIYFCDSSDSRQAVRMKKFNQWWQQLKPVGYIKIEETLVDSKNIEYPIAMIIKKSNPYKMEIIEAFLAIAYEENEK